jgi:hypothetical protein
MKCCERCLQSDTRSNLKLTPDCMRPAFDYFDRFKYAD